MIWLCGIYTVMAFGQAVEDGVNAGNGQIGIRKVRKNRAYYTTDGASFCVKFTARRQ